MMNPFLNSLVGVCVLHAAMLSILCGADLSMKEIDGASEVVISSAKQVIENKDDARVLSAAIESLRKKVASGDAFASLVIGHCQETGTGMGRSLQAALASYKVAAEGGVISGMRRYGRLLRLGSGASRPDYRGAREWLGKADASHDPGAMLELARMDLAGQGIAEPDPEKAQFLMKAAAEAGSIDAMVELGRGFKLGVFGEEPDAEEAKRWFERGQRAGDPTATLELGFLFEEGKGVVADMDRAYFLYRSAAEKNLPQALFQMGMCSLKGLGTQQEESTATEWFRKAANLGSTRAMYQLARMYEAGAPGVKQDFAKSNEWYEKAAMLGDLRSQNQLGMKYRDGRGVKKDPARSVKWFTSAVSQRFPPAMVNFGMMHETGLGTAVRKDLRIAARLYTEAAKQGDAVGQYLLARLFETGKGVPKDIVAAYVLAFESARQKHKPAATMRDNLKGQLTPEQLETAESRLKLR